MLRPLRLLFALAVLAAPLALPSFSSPAEARTAASTRTEQQASARHHRRHVAKRSPHRTRHATHARRHRTPRTAG
ncbi:hypothetical protein [Roseomonas sp. 18066]|uniref:hypothetical protein n=1 Tax=Roseomonas sp. 18066 TaxID=2681412 RepID=UPI0013568CA7|nr:hypothetical protein [Roseomonas sp. 18066]